jgi:hypothetical protein
MEIADLKRDWLSALAASFWNTELDWQVCQEDL